jgi:hypothetical protein
MPFVMPTEFQKEIALSTQKVYKSKLNSLASKGFDTVEKIQKEQKKVVEAIKEITGDGQDEKSRLQRRIMLSAIFWAIPLPTKNQYHTYWQKATPLKVVGGDNDGDKWKLKKNYKE